MSDSGFTQFPSRPSRPEQTGRATRSSEPNARLIGVPNDLRDVRRPVRVSGEVTRHNRDGSVRIRTDRGDIDVRLNNRKIPPPPRGQGVDVHIPAGKPPLTARVDYVQPQNQQQPSQQTQPTPQTTAEHQHQPPIPHTTETSQATPPRIATTPLDLNIPQSLSLQNEAQQTIFTPPAQDQQPLPFPLFETIRIEPITREQALNLITSPLETFFAQTTEIPSPLAQIAPDTTITDAPSQTPLTLSLDIQTIPNSPKIQTTQNTAIFEFLQRQTPILNQEIFEPLTQNIKPVNAAIIEFFAPEPAQTLQKNNFTAPVTPGLLETTITLPNIIPQTSNTIDVPLSVFENKTQIFVQNEPFFNAQVTKIDAPIPELPFAGKEEAPQSITKEPPNIITHNQQAQQSVATLIAQTPQSLPVFAAFPAITSSPEGLFFIAHAPGDTLSIGTQITLAPSVIAGTTSSYAAAQIAPLPSYFLTPETWNLLEDIQQTLLQTAPSIAQSMTNVTPSPSNPAQMSNALLFFVAAIRSGDLSAWTGQKVIDALRDAGKSKSISRLGIEGDALSRLASEPISQDWRALSIPMAWQNEIHKIALYYKHDDHDGDAEQEGQRPTRFIFDLKLDQMGSVQLDGWYKDKRLDLIVRTEHSFTKGAQQNMRKLYADGLRQTQIAGELTFQNQPETWVKITPDERNLGVSV